MEYDDHRAARDEIARLNRIEGPGRYYLCGGINKTYRVMKRPTSNVIYVAFRKYRVHA